MNRIAPQQTVAKHFDIMMWINALIIDLKLELQGKEHEPITAERLAEWDEKHSRDLERCRERAIFH